MQTKKNLESAQGAYSLYMKKMMAERQLQLEAKQREYVNKISDEVKVVLIKNAD